MWSCTNGSAPTAWSATGKTIACVTILLFALASLPPPLSAQGLTNPFGPVEAVFAKDGKVEDLPFEMHFGLVHLEVEMGGEKRLWLLDTGAGVSVVGKEYARDLQLGVGERTGSAVAASSRVGYTTVRVPELSLPGLKIRYGGECIEIPLTEFMHNFLGTDAIGILGFDFLSQVVTKIDYAGQTVSFYDPERFVYAGTGTSVDLEHTELQVRVPLTIDGEYHGRWMLDTGAGGSMFTHSYARENGILDLDGHTFMAAGAGGLAMIKFRRFTSATIGGYELDGPLFFCPTNGGGAAGHADYAGILGYSTLRNFVVHIDIGRRKLILEKGADYNTEFAFDKSGLQLMYGDEDEIAVLHVAPDTPAYDSGFERGDVILMFDGEPVPKKRGLLRMREQLNGEEGTEIDVTVRRGDEKITMPLTLGKYV